MTTTPRTILGIDPGTKEMGIVVLRRKELVEYGVHTLRNGQRPYDLIGQARRIVVTTIRRHQPEVVAIEAPLMIPTKRAALLSVIAQELRAQAKARRLEVVELSAAEVRSAVLGNPRATKIEIAEALVRRGGFDNLTTLVPKRPARPALWLSAKDRYWLHMFDALALAVAVERVRCFGDSAPHQQPIEAHPRPQAVWERYPRQQ
jgi:Holliday junction resolvasome RuvABC endonuclease subunit